MNSKELEDVGKQAEFIKSSETLYKEFKKLVRLVEKNSLAMKEEEIQFKLIAGMVKKDCLENTEMTGRFIQHQTMLHKKIKPIFPSIKNVLSRC